MNGEYICLPCSDGRSFQAYLARPANGPAPGIVLIQEIFGVNAQMREVADDLAAKGFLVIAPDLFWRAQPAIQLDPSSEQDRTKAMSLLQQLDVALAVNDCISAMDYLRALPASNGKVGALGYCLGGKLAYLMATRSNVDASVGYYGIGLQELLGEATSISKPLMLHIAGNDHLCQPPAREAIIKGLSGLPVPVAIHVYPEAGHAFARRRSAAYHEASAQAADARTLEFLSRNLSAG